MTRRFGVGLLAGSVLAVLTAMPAAAGGWASVVDDQALPPDDGGATVVRFRLLQHGMTPVDWGELSVVAVNAESGERVTGTATPQPGAPGTWDASFQLPSAGTWTLEILHRELEVMSSHPIRFTSAAPPSASAPATTGTVATWVGVALLALACLLPLGTAFVLARRRRSAPAGEARGALTTS